MAVDSDSRRAGDLARVAYGTAIRHVGQRSTPIEDEAERRAFNERVLAEFLGGQAPVGLIMYIIPPQTI